jgi:hypothetical protein
MDAALQLATDHRPRFELADPASGVLRTDRLRLRRALRSLVGQRGGVMLLTLDSFGAEVRIDCRISAAEVALELATDDADAAELLRGSFELLRTECARLGLALGRIGCAGPAPRPLAA